MVCEHGSPADFGQPERVAVLVHWSVQPVVSRSFRELVRQLSQHGYRTVIVSAAEFAEPLDWGGTLPAESIVLRKPNIGYDFGSWAVGLGVLPAITQAPYVILANDSLLGPFTDIGDLLADFESSIADVWGLTDTRQFSHHLQSYFLGLPQRGAGRPSAAGLLRRRAPGTVQVGDHQAQRAGAEPAAAPGGLHHPARRSAATTWSTPATTR